MTEKLITMNFRKVAIWLTEVSHDDSIFRIQRFESQNQLNFQIMCSLCLRVKIKKGNLRYYSPPLSSVVSVTIIGTPKILNGNSSNNF
jgi:uncharacterized lipoprotein YajG